MGPAEACWAYNQEVRRSKLRSAKNFTFRQKISIKFSLFNFDTKWKCKGKHSSNRKSVNEI